MKFAAHMLLFNCQRTFLAAVENCGPFVDRIYCAYSKEPWGYNPNAKNFFPNTFDLDILKRSKYYEKIALIEGNWDLEEDQRNSCRVRAQEDGMDFLIIHDADEFYTQRDYQRNIESIEKNPYFDVYKTPWCSYWKNLDWIIVNDKGEHVIGYPEFAINLKKEVSFVRARCVNSDNCYIIDGLCHHLSYVLSDDEVWNKINTWGHAHQFDQNLWYKEKWLDWKPNSRNLHPVYPKAWRRAKKGHLEKPKAFDLVSMEGLFKTDSLSGKGLFSRLRKKISL